MPVQINENMQYAHEPVGWAISALYFLGPKIVDLTIDFRHKSKNGQFI
jgi:hypothetical protein